MVGRERALAAIHEAGHAVIARKLGVEVKNVTARRKKSVATSYSAGWLAENLDVTARIEAYEKDAVIALSGYAAQRRAYPELTIDFDVDAFGDDGENGDMRNVQSAVYKAVCLRLGKPFPREGAMVEIDETMHNRMGEVFDTLKKRTAALVEDHWPAIKRVAKSLERHDHIDQTELNRLVEVAGKAGANN